jgi:GAF domain-containing protein
MLDSFVGGTNNWALILATNTSLRPALGSRDLDSIYVWDRRTVLPAKLGAVRVVDAARNVAVGVDDTGARHQGQTGYCTHIGNDLFAFFESTDSKSRQNFLEILRKPHTDYVINEEACAYWQRQKLPQALQAQLGTGPTVLPDPASWQEYLTKCSVTGARHVRIATEGALLGSLIAHGVSRDLVILSDGAPQFVVLVHASRWLHAERPLHRMVPYNETHREAIEGVRAQIWTLYQELKAYQQEPEASRKAELTSRFETLCASVTGFPSVDGVLGEMKGSQADLLRVLEHPEVPLHNNTSESHIREYVTKRKVSGGTRSELGRRCRDTFTSLKKTCRCLGVNFWEYLSDRVRRAGVVPRLAELIRRAAAEGVSGGVQAAPA